MPGFLAHVGATILCTHAAPVTAVTTNTRVLVSGMPVVLVADTYTVAGCPFTTPVPKPQPCVRVQWLVGTTRVLINGQPALIQTSTGLGFSVEQIPNGPPIIATTQTRVAAL